MQCNLVNSHISLKTGTKNSILHDTSSTRQYPHVYLLNNIQKKKTFLELNNPKIIRQLKKNTLSIGLETAIETNQITTETKKKESEQTAVAPGVELPGTALVKPKKKKDSPDVSLEKDYKLSKSKIKRKPKNYEPFEEEKVGGEDPPIDLSNPSSKLAYKKRNVVPKKKAKDASNSSIDKVFIPTEIIVTQPLPLKDVAIILHKTETEIIKFLFLQGIAVTINAVIDIPTIKKIADNFDVIVHTEEQSGQSVATESVLEQKNSTEKTAVQNSTPRAPVVVVLGHVDHGKTSLLDKIRKTQIVDQEAGGITQGLNVCSVNWEYEDTLETIVFLDTPGHEAFSQMRVRGASIMDIAILVIAADDIVQPQTIESIQYIQANQVPMIVALTKVDKATANTERIKEQLSEYGVISEEWGGDTIFVPVSAFTGENISTLLDSIVLTSSIQNFTADPDASGQGTIIEAHLDKNKGVAITVLVQNGIFRKGDVVTAHTLIGKIRMIEDDSQQVINEATPSQIVKLWGFAEIPQVGKLVQVHENDKKARTYVKELNEEDKLLTHSSSNMLTGIHDSTMNKDTKVFNVIVKSNTQGGVEAICHVIQQLPQSKVQVKIVSALAGEITETDVVFAATTKSVILGFCTTMAPGARQASVRLNIAIYEYQVIYDLVDKVTAEMLTLLDPEYEKEEIGISTVKDIFELARGKVAGCYVESGKIVSNANIQVIRNNEVLYEGALDSLKRIKEDVKEVLAGDECGVLVKNFQNWQKGDSIKAFTLKEKVPSLG
uniref:translation initiation factor 2 n=1 Tax=Chroodactylon ornatum TaxID=139907 RepID=UPI001FCD4B1C|nr:translation initiation factor 2 [Chroodactylon ornatum]UNJ14594.1 translation initiation factor 2 [Chroodactylon ornatum]